MLRSKLRQQGPLLEGCPRHVCTLAAVSLTAANLPLLSLNHVFPVFCLIPCLLPLQVSLRPIVDMEEELRARRQFQRAGGNEAYESDSDEEGAGGGRRVQCAQQ